MIEKVITTKDTQIKDYVYEDTRKLIEMLQGVDLENKLTNTKVISELNDDYTQFHLSSSTDSYYALAEELAKILYNTNADMFTFANNNRIFYKAQHQNHLNVSIKLEKINYTVIRLKEAASL